MMKMNQLLMVVGILAVGTLVSARTASADDMKMQGKKMADCQEMKQQREKMREEMKAQDASLTEQVARMNSAPEGKKMGLIAEIVTRMVEERTAMHERMEKMQDRMMQHMMGHMQMGKDSMAKCPMMKDMKGMKGMDETSDDAHQEHHKD